MIASTVAAVVVAGLWLLAGVAFGLACAAFIKAGRGD